MTPPPVRLDCARAEDFMPTVASASVSLIFIDPPYFRVLDEAWDHQWPSEDAFLAWLGGILDECKRVLAPNGSIYVCAAVALSDRVSVELMRPRFRILNQIRWSKPTGRAGRACKEDLRAYFPHCEAIIFAEQRGADLTALGESGYAAECADLRGTVFEPIRAYLEAERQAAGVAPSEVNAALGNQMAGHYFGRSQWALPTAENYAKMRALFNRDDGAHLRCEYAHLRREYDDLRREYDDLREDFERLRRPFNVTADVPHTDVWTYATVPPGPGRHPAEKPLDMLLDVIRASSRPGDLVLDCFAGGGTTAAACVDTGRAYVGCEMDPATHDAAVDRVEKHEAIRDGRPLERKRTAGGFDGPLFA